jgi:predicted NBD/HSP70 family sugar kinase
MVSLRKPPQPAASFEAESSGPARIRQLNRNAVLHYVRLHGQSARSSLIKALRLSPAAISSVVNELLEDGLLRESESVGGARGLGRPRAQLELVADAAYTLGLVLRPGFGRVQVESAWSDYRGDITLCEPIVVTSTTDEDRLVAGVMQALAQLEQVVPAPERISAVTVGIPGVVDGVRVHIAPRLKLIQGTAFLDQLRSLVRYRLSFENDVNLATMAELQQQPRLREQRFAFLFIAAGVGSGIALNGQLMTGHGWAGEVGQLRITRARKRRYTFEELLGTNSRLADQLEKLNLPRDGLDALADAIDARNAPAVRVVDDYADTLCDLIQVLNAVLDLDEVVVDFPSDRLLERLLPRVQATLTDSPLRVALSTPSLGHGASARGAALNALDGALPVIQRRAKA